MKSIREWYEGVQDVELRTKLLARLDPAHADLQERSLFNALYMGFNWDGTPEGFDYWTGVVDNNCF